METRVRECVRANDYTKASVFVDLIDETHRPYFTSLLLRKAINRMADNVVLFVLQLPSKISLTHDAREAPVRLCTANCLPELSQELQRFDHVSIEKTLEWLTKSKRLHVADTLIRVSSCGRRCQTLFELFCYELQFVGGWYNMHFLESVLYWFGKRDVATRQTYASLDTRVVDTDILEVEAGAKLLRYAYEREKSPRLVALLTRHYVSHAWLSKFPNLGDKWTDWDECFVEYVFNMAGERAQRVRMFLRRLKRFRDDTLQTDNLSRVIIFLVAERDSATMSAVDDFLARSIERGCVRNLQAIYSARDLAPETVDYCDSAALLVARCPAGRLIANRLLVTLAITLRPLRLPTYLLDEILALLPPIRRHLTQLESVKTLARIMAFETEERQLSDQPPVETAPIRASVFANYATKRDSECEVFDKRVILANTTLCHNCKTYDVGMLCVGGKLRWLCKSCRKGGVKANANL
jgi:hypothetical protein